MEVWYLNVPAKETVKIQKMKPGYWKKHHDEGRETYRFLLFRCFVGSFLIIQECVEAFSSDKSFMSERTGDEILEVERTNRTLDMEELQGEAMGFEGT